MASPDDSHGVLGKRKRDEDDGAAEHDIEDDEDTLFIPDENSLSLVVYGTKFDDDANSITSEAHDVHDDSSEKSEGESGDEEDVLQELHDESMEKVPNCTVYDPEIEKIISDLTNLPSQVHALLERYECDGKHITAHRASTQDLGTTPTTKRLRIALIGNAGQGQSNSPAISECID
jgi:hypothetical protein